MAIYFNRNKFRIFETSDGRSLTAQAWVSGGKNVRTGKLSTGYWALVGYYGTLEDSVKAYITYKVRKTVAGEKSKMEAQEIREAIISLKKEIGQAFNLPTSELVPKLSSADIKK